MMPPWSQFARVSERLASEHIFDRRRMTMQCRSPEVVSQRLVPTNSEVWEDKGLLPESSATVCFFPRRRLFRQRAHSSSIV
jgi:hypothetical protein